MELYWSEDEVFAAGQQAVASQSPSDKLLTYLKDFQSDKLSTGTVQALPSYSTQRAILIANMSKKYAGGQGYHQTMYGLDVSVPRIWELMLCMDFITHEIQLSSNMGFGIRDFTPGIRSARKIPHAEYTIIDEKLKAIVSQTAKPAPPTAPANIVFAQPAATSGRNVKAEIVIVDRIIYARLEDGRELRISRRLRTGMSPLAFFNYVLRRPSTNINRHDIKEATGSSDITELVRRCGFDQQLKEIFFPDTTEQAVCFQPSRNLTQVQLKLLVEHKWDKVRNGGKN